MRIDDVEIFEVRLPLVRSFETSSSKKSSITHLLIRVRHEGLVGWGECAAPVDPFYCPETTETCFHILRDFLVPSMLGRDWDSIEEFVGFHRLVKGNGFARAGLEMAACDLLSRSRGQSLAEFLGGTRTEILSGVSLGIERDHAALPALIERYLSEGYRRIKLKIAPGHDVDVVAAVRGRFPEIALQVDANSAYTLEDSSTLEALDDFGLILIEQPLAHDDIIDHAQLQARMKTPICLDESIHSAADARKAIEIGACRIINIKVGRVGGLLEAKRIHDVCREHGVPVWCGGMHEFGVGRAANLAISSLPNFSIPGDVSGSDKYFHEDVVVPPIMAENGSIPVPTGPGLGITVMEDRIRTLALRSWSSSTIT
ncbi:MAG: o-succinylbenzoate synthase [Isosphaeraceae bacterium]|nr:o-succinylbenzoate synthase [Isosphaeraceae bacterium]